MKRIVLCADDYGQNIAVSQAIIHLLAKNSLSATSCLSTAPLFPTVASELTPFKTTRDLGLHFNLTLGQPLSPAFIKEYGPVFPSLPRLMGLSACRLLKKEVILAEFEAQLNRFTDYLGQLPDFVDGHQHIHQFPVIREAFLMGWQQHLKAQGSYIRSTHRPILSALQSIKHWMIEQSGAAAFKKILMTRHIPHNTSFEGIYDFSIKRHYPTLFRQFLNQVHDRGLIMCHPGTGDVDSQDEIAAARIQEYQYFMSESFTTDCNDYSVACVRFQDMR